MSPRLPAAVIDTTLLSRLQLVGLDELLPWVFARVHVPPVVRAEVGAGPGKARRRLARLFRKQPDFYVDCRDEDPMVAEVRRVDLDPGEAAVIAQADYVGAVVIIDERLGARRAEDMSITVVRTGGLLCSLKEAGAIEAVGPYLERLVEHGFRLSPKALDAILEQAGEAR
jgi:predicted nucleic acid-binding protein